MLWQRELEALIQQWMNTELLSSPIQLHWELPLLSLYFLLFSVNSMETHHNLLSPFLVHKLECVSVGIMQELIKTPLMHVSFLQREDWLGLEVSREWDCSLPMPIGEKGIERQETMHGRHLCSTPVQMHVHYSQIYILIINQNCLYSTLFEI